MVQLKGNLMPVGEIHEVLSIENHRFIENARADMFTPYGCLLREFYLHVFIDAGIHN